MSFQLQQTQEKRNIVNLMALNRYKLKAKLSLHITRPLFIIFPFLILEKKTSKENNALIAIFDIATTSRKSPGPWGVGGSFLMHPLAMSSEWMFTVAFC
jgi:hypothetical protein